MVPTVPMVVGDDLEACTEPVRHYAALYVGGMGEQGAELLLQPAGRADGVRRGCRTRAGLSGAAASRRCAAVPFEFLDRTSLLGPLPRIAERLHAYADSGVTTLSVAPYARALEQRLAVVACGGRGLAVHRRGGVAA